MKKKKKEIHSTGTVSVENKKTFNTYHEYCNGVCTSGKLSTLSNVLPMMERLPDVYIRRLLRVCKLMLRRRQSICWRYASLYFCCAIEEQDNELITLEIIHRFVELLDKYFGSVCELDIIFNFEKAYFILDEFLMGGEIQDTSKKSVLKAIEQADLLQEVTWHLDAF
uniref:AP complex mu/sigma subunit domain-containing protein n=1 Tax=Monopterus albus TaxID=43700 RepID=A0A3Q3QPU9_MONAL